MFRSSNLNVIPRADPVVVAARAVPVHWDAAADEPMLLLRVAVLSVTEMMLKLVFFTLNVMYWMHCYSSPQLLLLWPPGGITQAGEAGVLSRSHLCPRQIHLPFKGAGDSRLLPVPLAPEAARTAVLRRGVGAAAGGLGRHRRPRALDLDAADLESVFPQKYFLLAKKPHIFHDQKRGKSGTK